MTGALGLIDGTAFRVAGLVLRVTQGSAATAQPRADLCQPRWVAEGRIVRGAKRPSLGKGVRSAYLQRSVKPRVEIGAFDLPFFRLLGGFAILDF